MELENSRLYDLEVKDLTGDEVTKVTKKGWELMQEYPFLRVGQIVIEWKSFFVSPFGA